MSFNNKIRLTSELYVGQEITRIELDSKKGASYDYTISKQDLVDAGLGTVMPAEGLVFGSANFGNKTENNIYGTWTIYYDNGCSQTEEDVSGIMAGCGNINATLPTTVFYEGQQVSYVEGLLQHNEDFDFNGFNELTGTELVPGDAGTITSNFTIPADNGSQPYENAGPIDCETFTITVAEEKNCTDIGAVINPADQTIGQAVEVSGYDDTIFTEVSVSPTNFAVGNQTYIITFGTTNNEAYFFGLEEDGETPIPRTNCTVQVTAAEFDCNNIQLTLTDIELSGTTAAEFFDGISIYDELTLVSDGGTGVTLATEQPNWVIGTDNVYNVNLNLTGTGLYNDAGVYEGPQTCQVTGTACKDDLASGFQVVSQQQS